MTEVSTGRILNETAIREHALKCSEVNRAGKFTRVGESFLDEIQAEVEGVFRKEIRSKYQEQVRPLVDAGSLTFVTGALMEKIREELNAYIARLIQNRVQRQPTVGKTLGRTQ